MTKNATNHIMMVRPVRFGMNAQTAVDNYYQNQDAASSWEEDNAKAQAEFDAFVAVLRDHGVEVMVVQDELTPHTPDSIFPNNWISMHDSGKVVLYPMKAENRRLERLSNIKTLLGNQGFVVDEIQDLSPLEEQGVFLEGTGAIIFDHDCKLAYLARSQRADEQTFVALCEQLGYEPVVFSAYQDTPNGRQPIYHTNVLMCMTDQYAVICLDTIDDAAERAMVEAKLRASGKGIVEISEAQKHLFAGNMLLVKGSEGRLLLVTSQSASDALTAEQRETIEQHHTIVSSDLTTIETLGGGSARCMLAEIYLPKPN